VKFQIIFTPPRAQQINFQLIFTLTQIGVKIQINFHASALQRINSQSNFTHADWGENPN